MSDFNPSKEKFEEALMKLEQVVEDVLNEKLELNQKSIENSVKNELEDIHLIREERDELQKKLNEATKNYDSLSTITSQLSIRLDKTINKLKSVLES